MNYENGIAQSTVQDVSTSGRESVEVSFGKPDGYGSTQVFSESFRIGRDKHCEVRISNKRVGRNHLEVFRQNNRWWVRDLASGAGTYCGDQSIIEFPLVRELTLTLGKKGPSVLLRLCEQTGAARQPLPSVAHQVDEPMVSHPTRRHWIAGIVLVTLGCLSVPKVYEKIRIFIEGQETDLKEAKELALRIFYSMKTLELQIANLEAEIIKASRQKRLKYMTEMARREQEFSSLRDQYQKFLTTLGLINVENDEERLILRIAQLFGECEVNMPLDFVDHVKRYINEWKTTSRLESAMRSLEKLKYAPLIQKELIAQKLPAQFLYLALVESNFNREAVGPATRYGFAKGMWQFIPATGERFGLKIGPRKDYREFDSGDERHDIVKSTRAAAAYIRYIYRTDAQASGLLVMASYNWGEGNVIRLIRRLPENPRERNFWELFKRYRDKIPNETRNYVFRIISAAVIGENPRLFGFDFDNPLQRFSSS